MSSSVLPLRDTKHVYGKVSRVFHWGLAALILWQFFGMVLKITTGWKPSESAILRSHGPVGVVIFVLMTLRLVWALLNAGNRPDHGRGLLGLAAKIGHGLLYLALLLVPMLALLRAWGSDRPFAPFGFEIFPARDEAIGWAVALGNDFHGELGWLTLVLILGHVVMVGVHQAMWRDGTLAKMVGRKAL